MFFGQGRNFLLVLNKLAIRQQYDNLIDLCIINDNSVDLKIEDYIKAKYDKKYKRKAQVLLSEALYFTVGDCFFMHQYDFWYFCFILFIKILLNDKYLRND